MALVITKLTSKILDDRKECMAYVDDIRARAAPRQRNANVRYAIPSEVIVEMASKDGLPQPCFASTETVNALVSGALKDQWDKLTKRFYDNVEVVRDIVLANGEESISERFTYLELPFLGHAKGTAAFVRETNYVEYCYLVPGHIVLGEASCKDLLRIEKPQVRQYGVVRKTTISGLGKLLGEGVVNGFLGNIGVLIFNGIFAPDMTDFVDAFYKDIQKVVDSALTEETIAQLNGVILGTEQWVRGTYTMQKEGGYSKDKLTEALAPVEDDITRHVLGVLRDERYASAGIGVFLIGAGMHLAILQELALVDPEFEPEKSPYYESVKFYAKEHGDHVTTTVDDIMKKRLDMIKLFDEDVQSNQFTFDMSAWWEDSYDNTKSKFWTYEISSFGDSGDPDYHKHAKEDMDKHISAVRKDWLSQIGDPYVVVEDWKTLQEKPLPPQ